MDLQEVFKVNEISINGWQVTTEDNGEIFIRDDRCIILIDGVQVASVFVSKANTLRISTKDGFVTQMAPAEKIVMVLKEA